MELAVFYHIQKGGKGDPMDSGPEQGEVLREDFQHRRQQVHLQMVVAAQFKGNKVGVVPQTFPGGQGGFQNQVGVGQKEKALLGQGNVLAGAAEQFDFQLLLQRADLVADRRLGHLQTVRRF